MEIPPLIPSCARAGQSLTGSPPARTLLPGILKSVSHLGPKICFRLSHHSSYHHLHSSTSIHPILNWHLIWIKFFRSFSFTEFCGIGNSNYCGPEKVPHQMQHEKERIKCSMMQNYNNQHCGFLPYSQECIANESIGVSLKLLCSVPAHSAYVLLHPSTEHCCASADFDLLLVLSFLALSQSSCSRDSDCKIINSWNSCLNLIFRKKWYLDVSWWSILINVYIFAIDIAIQIASW